MPLFPRLLMAGALVVACVAPAALVSAQPRLPEVAKSPVGDVAFPPGFLWGAATAAHQVEGGLRNDWETFEATPGNVKQGHTSREAVDHYNRFDEDFALAQDMNHNAHRMSVEWSRLEPRRGEWDETAIAHYHEVFASMRARGLEPLVTLHHFTNPQWVAAQGGWDDARTIADFERFAGFMGREFGADVDTWMTINEPNIYAYMAFMAGAWPPKRQDPEAALRVQANLALGHARAYKALHRYDTTDGNRDGTATSVGLAQHVALYDPYTTWSPLDRAQAYFNDDVFNRAFLRAVTTGVFDFGYPSARGIHTRHDEAKNTVDFIGVNYYTRWLCASFGPKFRLPMPGAPTNALGWEIYPQGIYRALALANDYTRLPDGRRVPLMVTENGVDDPQGEARSAYLVQHVREVGRAIADGMDVRGYIHWTLMDNFEWSEGYAPQFGLYQVDRRPGAKLARVATPAVATFRAIAAANGASAALAGRYAKIPATKR